MTRVQNEKSGKFVNAYTEDDMRVFKDLVRSGTTYTGFTQFVMKNFPDISAATANNWWYKTRKEVASEK